jgi:hypothetical protein
LNPERQAEQDHQQPTTADGSPERTQASPSGLDGPPGRWTAAAAAWLLGVAASVFQFVQGFASGPNLYSWFLAVLSFIIGVVLVAFAISATKENTIRKYLVLLGAIVPLLFGSASFGFLVRDTSESVTPAIRPLSVSIAEPVLDQLVGHDVPVKGVVVNMPPGKQIWIAVTGQMNDVDIPYQFYVKGNNQGDPCTVANNSFECNGIFVGKEQDTNRYELIPVVADQSQASGFRQCMKDITSQTICSNIRPDGIQLGAGVFVKRQ